MRTTHLAHLATLLAEDVQMAAHHWLFSALGGSIYLPRAARRWIFRLAGADVASALGPGLTYGGPARNLTIGPNVYLNQQVFIEAVAPVVIGAGTAIGMQAMIVTSTHPIGAGDRWQERAGGEPVTIGERCWIGARAVILPGVTIAAGSVIAAGAVVSKDCPVAGVYAGVPARRIRDLHPTDPAPEDTVDVTDDVTLVVTPGVRTA